MISANKKTHSNRYVHTQTLNRYFQQKVFPVISVNWVTAHQVEILFWEQLAWHWQIFSISEYHFHDSGFWNHNVNHKYDFFKMPK